jgi:hypothetical protein
MKSNEVMTVKSGRRRTIFMIQFFGFGVQHNADFRHSLASLGTPALRCTLGSRTDVMYGWLMHGGLFLHDKIANIE